MADDSALIVVAPGDSVDAIIRKIRGADAQSVQQLTPGPFAHELRVVRWSAYFFPWPSRHLRAIRVEA